ncbi:sensor histidine kinase [Streptomyces sp. NPDC048172]|uniref:sensor histidine kinase n=1 Tax=Streptomyces sp. NPDC048172 TaxID=3365505 RepID=UPI003713B2F0
MIDGRGVTGFAPRSLLPGELAAASVGAEVSGRNVRRTFRDGVVDGLLFIGAVMVGLFMLGTGQSTKGVPPWLQELDPLLGAVSCLALWARRRFPLGVTLLALPAISMSASAFGAGMVIIANLAIRVPWNRSIPVLGLCLLASVPNLLIVSVPRGDVGMAIAITVAYYLLFFAWGSALRARRMLVLKLREEADRERADHARRLADARRAERRAIAREMHDVMAHRISLLSVHAGALAYRSKQAHAGTAPALSDAEVSESAEVIRGNAHQALEELREVLHILRSEGGEEGDEGIRTDGTEGTAAPQPRLEDVRHLIEEARTAGQPVDFRDGELRGDGVRGDGVRGDEPRGDELPLRPQQQRTVYRVVQEGLTNARKHAPGAKVTVRLGGTPGGELTVEVRNPLPSGASSSGIPGAGAGLTGLSERVGLEGGVLEHDGAGGMFILRARLPWPAR